MMLVAGFVGCGGDVTRPDQDTVQQPQRIICGSPAVAEIVFALGCGNRVVGVSDYTTYPPEALDVAKIGGWMNPSRERLLRLAPDLIITQGQHPALAAFAAEYNILFLSVNVDNLQNILNTINDLATKLDASARGAELVSSITGAMSAIGEIVQPADAVSVMLAMGRSPGSLGGLSTAGPGTFLDEMITLAGGSNIFSDATGQYPLVSKESLLARAPDVIIDVHSAGLPSQTQRKMRNDWQSLAAIPAVANERIYLIEEQLLLIPGPRIAEAAELLARIIHPDRFHE